MVHVVRGSTTEKVASNKQESIGSFTVEQNQSGISRMRGWKKRSSSESILINVIQEKRT